MPPWNLSSNKPPLPVGRSGDFSCPFSLLPQLRTPLTTLKSALSNLSLFYTHPIPPLLPRLALFLFGHIASRLQLLEHAVWSQVNCKEMNEESQGGFMCRVWPQLGFDSM